MLRYTRSMRSCSHHRNQFRRPFSKLSRRDSTSHLPSLHLQDVAEYSVGKEASDLHSNTLESILEKSNRIGDVGGEVGIGERRIGPGVSVVQEIEENESERPDVRLSRIVGRLKVVSTFCSKSSVPIQRKREEND